MLARAFRPPGNDSEVKPWHGIAAVLLSIYITLMASAEVLAIAVAVGGGATGGIRVTVAVALVVAIFGFGLAILIPWALRFHQARQTHWLIATVLGVIFLAFFGWGSVYLMEFAFEGSLEENLQARLNRVTDERERDYLEWSRAAMEAHADHHVSRMERHDLALLRKRKAHARELELSIVGH